MKKSHRRKSIARQRPRTPAQRTTISLCVIARNEERFIGDCLASAQPFVDQVIVLDTGSFDATPTIARAYGAQVGHFEWQDDFAAARNAAIELATGDWILMLDADERLQPASGPALRTFVESNPNGPFYYAPCIENLQGDSPDNFTISFPNRLFQRRPDLRYVGAIHEDLFCQPDATQMGGLRLDFIRITHLGYTPDVIEARRKFDRNRRLLLRETVARPEDPLAWYFLGMDQLSANHAAEAAEYLRRSLACTGNRPAWSRVDVYTHLVLAYVQLDDAEPLELIVEEAERSGALSTTARTTYSRWLENHGRDVDAVRQLLAALEPNQPAENVREPGVGGWSTRMEVARIYERKGNASAALRQVELGLKDPELPARSDVASIAARLAVEVGDIASLARSLDDVTQPEEDDIEGHLQLLEWRALADGTYGAPGNWHAAYDAARALPGRTMAEAARILFVAKRLRADGAPEAALDLLGHLYDAQPALPRLHGLLTAVLADLGRYDDALAANEILQSLLTMEKCPAAA